MAKIAVFIDRPPHDIEWKGAVAWDVVRTLAEAQHEVLALTTVPVADIALSHGRLTIVQPAPSFALQHAPRWLTALLSFRPDVVHSFALQPTSSWSVWPALKALAQGWTAARWFSTVFSPDDFAPFLKFNTPLDVSELVKPTSSPRARAAPHDVRPPSLLIPAPVGEWHRPQVNLLLLVDFLENHRDSEAHILGGWGEAPLRLRREGWRWLANVSERVHMHGPVALPEFVTMTQKHTSLWLHPLGPDHWRALVATHVAESLGLPTLGPRPVLAQGSTANFLSRVYSW